MTIQEFYSSVTDKLPATLTKKIPDLNTLLQLYFKQGLSVSQAIKTLQQYGQKPASKPKPAKIKSKFLPYDN